jgi:hypothetical protein
MPDWNDAAIVLVPVLFENGDSPRAFFSDRESRGAKVSNGIVREFREYIIGHPQIELEGCWRMLVDHSVPVGVRAYDMPLGNSASNKIRIMVGNPSKKVAIGFNRFAFEKV